jgi:hypothetical protein
MTGGGSRNPVDFLLRNQRHFVRVLRGVAIFVLVATLGVKVLVQADFWAGQRLSGALAWLYGVPLYDPAGGPRTGWAYFPFGAVLLSWTSLLGRPSLAMFAASLTSVAAMLGPVVVYVLWATDGKARSVGSRLLYVAAFLSICLNLRSVDASLFGVHVDGLAIGFCALSAVLLSLCAQGRLERTRRVDALIAALAIASFWTKQNQLLTPLAILCASLACSGWKSSRRLLSYLALFGAGSLVLVAAFFDVNALVLNCITMVSRFPWRTGFSAEGYSSELGALSKLRVLLTSSTHLYRDVVSLIAASLGCWWLSQSGVRRDDPGAGKGLLVLAVIALFMIPLSVTGPAKLGGAPNGYSPFVYFLVFLFVALLHRLPERPRTFEAPDLVLITLTPLVLFTFLSLFQQLRVTPENAEDVAFSYLRKNPGRAFFPDQPTAHLLADHTVYVVGYSIMDRQWASMDVSPAWLRRFVPDSISEIVVLKDQPQMAILAAFPEFRSNGNRPDLPGFTVFRRTSPGEAPREISRED